MHIVRHPPSKNEIHTVGLPLSKDEIDIVGHSRSKDEIHTVGHPLSKNEIIPLAGDVYSWRSSQYTDFLCQTQKDKCHMLSLIYRS